MDDIDQRIAHADPAAPTAEVPELADMIASARDEVGAARTRRLRPVVAIGLATVVALGGAGTAAAVGEWSPWAQHPDIVFTFTMPSGEVCEQRMGNIQGADPEAVASLQDYVDRVDVFALADIDAAIAEIRADTNVTVLPDGTEAPAGYGTPYYDADLEYHLAVHRAVNEVLTDELERRDFPPDAVESWEGEMFCS